MNPSDQIVIGTRGAIGRADASPRYHGVALPVLAVCVATFLGSQFGAIVRFPDAGSAILFPPYAVLTSALILSPPSRWWVFLFASFVGHMLTVSFADSLTVAFAASTELANFARALSIAGALRWLKQDRPRFDSLEGTAVFLVVAGLLAPAVGATVGAPFVVLFGHATPGPEPYWRIWRAWFLSNTIVGVTLLPLILAVVAHGHTFRRSMNGRRVVELSVLLGGLAAVSFVALVGSTLAGFDRPVRLYAPLPFLLWAAMRFGPATTSASLLIVTAFAITGVTNGLGPFARTPSDDGVLSLYLFLVFTSVPSLLLAALMKERLQVLAVLNDDIAERKRAQEALQSGEERMALAATSANLGFWAWNLRTDAVWLSDHGRHVWGLPISFDSTCEHLVARIHEEDRQRVSEACADAVTRREPCEQEFRTVRDDGKLRWLSLKGRLEFEGDGTPKQMVGVVIDVTERKRAEIELQDRRQELAHLGRVATLGQMSGALAHELRQPLTAIQFNARAAQNILEKEQPDLAEVRAILKDIAHDDARAGEVIARLRGLLKKGVGQPSYEPLQLSTVVEEVLDIARGDVMARGVGLTTELESPLSPVYGDRVELQQVLVNLVLNACEAMGCNPPEDRRLTVGTTCDDTGFVVAYVVDRGTGIRPDKLEQVFEPFVTSKADGLGLGLAICRTIVNAHRGRLWATNNPEGGATFYLALPPCA